MSSNDRPSPYRWVVLGVFSLAAGLSQLLWLNFAPLVSLVEKRYGVSEDQAGLLLLVFPLIYIFLSLPAGALIDRKGYVFSVGLGSALMAAFSCLRILDGGFWLLLAAQCGIAVAQPFVVNGISKLVLDWFPKEQDALANGIGTMGMFIGMAAGMGTTPALVERLGYTPAMGLYAAVTVAICAAFLLLARANPANAAEAPSGPAAAFGMEELRHLMRNRGLLLVFLLAFLGLGFFNGLTTWIEPILAPNGINSLQAGAVGAMLILGGIVGAVVIPGLSDHFRRHKPFLLASVLAALATLYPLCHSDRYTLLLGLGALQGFFFLPAFALLLAMCSELAGQAYAGAATGVLMLAGNAGAVLVIVGMEWVNGLAQAKTFGPAVNLLIGVLAVTLVCALFVSETHPGLRTEA